LTLLSRMQDKNITLVCIQNYGGRIFEELPYIQSYFSEEKAQQEFMNIHHCNLSKIAEGFGINVVSLENLKNNNGAQFVELVVDIKQDKAFKLEESKLKKLVLGMS